MKLNWPDRLFTTWRAKRSIASAATRTTIESSPADPRALVGANDLLTGLPGLTAFEGTLMQAARRADAESTQLALLFVNLDDLKSVNMSAGRKTGDYVLRQTARRLRPLAKPFMVARLVGDEFLLLMPDDPQRRDASALASQVQEAIAVAFPTDTGEVSLSCSIGIAMYPEHGASSALIAHAQAAMGETREAGGAGYAFFEPRMMQGKRDQLELLKDLRGALGMRQLELFYQPKIHAPSGEITGVEALLRWNHPTRGMISPTVFIPIAERYGLIVKIGSWVIDEACRQARAWRDQGLRMKIAINLSVQQLRQANLAIEVAGALENYQVNPDLITCEVTENGAMEDVETSMRVLGDLDRLGVHISIDDFGTGHSSLSYLRTLPADELKIDRSFVLDLETSEDARKVALAVVNLAKALNLKVVAEGVETEGQNSFLREMGCDQLQGYLFAKPMSAAALALWAKEDEGPRALNFRASIFKETACKEANSTQAFG